MSSKNTTVIVLVVLGLVIGLPILSCGGCVMIGAMLPDSDEPFAPLSEPMFSADDMPEPQGITMQQFSEVRPGMTYDEVVGILGEPDQLLSESELGGISTRILMWQGRSTIGNANVTFQGGVVAMKAQAFLD